MHRVLAHAVVVVAAARRYPADDYARVREDSSARRTGPRGRSQSGRRSEDYWIVTTRAVYIFPTPSRANERAGRTRGRRFPFSAIGGISEIERGAFVERTMNLNSDIDGTAEVVSELIDTTFKGKVVAAIERQLAMNAGKDRRPDGQ